MNIVVVLSQGLLSRIEVFTSNLVLHLTTLLYAYGVTRHKCRVAINAALLRNVKVTRLTDVILIVCLLGCRPQGRQ